MQIVQKTKRVIKKSIKSAYKTLPKSYQSKIYEMMFVDQTAQQRLIDNALGLCLPCNDKEKQKKLFKTNVQYVEIETASFCNRTCWFCPNSQIDRKSQSIELDEKAYLRIMSDLAQIDYDQNVHFHRFNEPLANKELILKRVRQAREHLPNANFTIFTNGDYLDISYVKDLQEAGLNNILMSFYFGKNVDFDAEGVIKPAIQKMSQKLGLKTIECRNDEEEYSVNMFYKNLQIIYRAWNPKCSGTNRGGTIKGVGKSSSEIYGGCFQPAVGFFVDYNGLVMPCCNTRSDIKSHESFILGDTNKESIFDIYMGEKFLELRKELFLGHINNPICKNCSARWTERFLKTNLFE